MVSLSGGGDGPACGAGGNGLSGAHVDVWGSGSVVHFPLAVRKSFKKDERGEYPVN